MHVDDLGARLPAAWKKRGGVLFPMRQAEATWIRFHGGYPMAVKVAAGMINAVTGAEWTNSLHEAPQDYLVVPDQPWLDGFCVATGQIRQFVAMPLGDGYSAEEQLTGKAEYGGVQLIVYPMKRELYAHHFERSDCVMESRAETYSPMTHATADMGLGPGGLMRQEIYADGYGMDAWETEVFSRCFVHIANSRVYRDLTGREPPAAAPTAADYTAAGLPWFDYYAEHAAALPGSAKLADLDSVAATGTRRGAVSLPENEAVAPAHLQQPGQRAVREDNS